MLHGDAVVAQLESSLFDELADVLAVVVEVGRQCARHADGRLARRAVQSSGSVIVTNAAD